MGSGSGAGGGGGGSTGGAGGGGSTGGAGGGGSTGGGGSSTGGVGGAGGGVGSGDGCGGWAQEPAGRDGRRGGGRARCGRRLAEGERTGDAGDGLAGATLGFAGTLLRLVDPAEHLLQPALALCLLSSQVREALGARGALLGLPSLRFDLVETGSRLLEGLLGALTLVGDPLLGLVELLDQLTVALAATVDLLVGDAKLVGEGIALVDRGGGAASLVGGRHLGAGGAALGCDAKALHLADTALGVGVGLGGLRPDDRVVLALLGGLKSFLGLGGRRRRGQRRCGRLGRRGRVWCEWSRGGNSWEIGSGRGVRSGRRRGGLRRYRRARCSGRRGRRVRRW